ncbi:hydrogen dependent carbon dioxide reductase subunit FdhF [Thermoanaerobacter kivui]|uniref:Hydrogen dependent carbon dioxide reductase subunit FdhF n=1 Tax=Thermoanaerobacter kivui TaxID=2325 RepID=A0A097ATK5_THEKI|nr:formate dehydrogenase subunit alpha [Thermoanaerobacter kivui]AIS53143.1 hydrogen dependent carbon dioxide reductase subunit FdhF [Thermoanaerobacter kivui]7QV7_S Chain S, Hydrogen dependent carbon dioxide reductase subunit FdhF [Thermoanaerobacter kivui]7QV7_Y Chain Y, Hydrogen dependent carbon dioxide reductase subunit FdhF [Thermoanaerobacter kivui]
MKDGKQEKVLTTCPYCGTGCGLYLKVENEKIVGVEPDKLHPVNQGELCIKGYYGYKYVHDPRRLTSPLIKKNGKFVPVSWDEALNFIANGLKKIKSEYGSDAFAMFCSARATNEDNYAAQKFARAVIGINNVDHCARLCHAPTVAGLAMTLGSGAMTNSIPEISTYSDVIFIIGSNTAECHPLIAAHVIKAKERGAKLIVADPRMNAMVHKADIWLRVPSGYNIPLINGMIHIIIKEGLVKTDFVKNHAVGFEEMAKAVEKYTPEYVEELTGIPKKDLIKAARFYGQAQAAAILYSMGVTQFSHGTGNVVSLANLAVITGNLGRPGAGICPLRGQNNVQGACDVGALPNVLPGYLDVTKEQNRERFEKVWGVKLPSNIGLRVTEVPDAILNKRVRALYIFGENPIMSDPDSDHLRHALEHLDLLIVQDIFLTETARLAHVVLPAACWAEKDGTFTNTERRVQRVRKAVEAPGEAKPDWWIFSQIAERMGYTGMQYNNVQEIWDEVRKIVPEKFGGISYARLEKEKGLAWPCPTEDHTGTPILYLGGKFATPSGKAQMYPVIFYPNTCICDEGAEKQDFNHVIVGSIAELPDEEYPFTLTTGRRVYHYHTATMTRKSPVIDQIAPQELVEINPQDATRLGINDGDFLRVSTRRGYVATRAWVTERVPKGTIFMTFHYWEACCNELTNTASDAICCIPEFKVAAAKVEKISQVEAQAILKEKIEKYQVELEKDVANMLAKEKGGK